MGISYTVKLDDRNDKSSSEFCPLVLTHRVKQFKLASKILARWASLDCARAEVSLSCLTRFYPACVLSLLPEGLLGENIEKKKKERKKRVFSVCETVTA